jgi:hypothetical protein
MQMLNEKPEVKIITNANSVMSARTKADKRFVGEFYFISHAIANSLVKGVFISNIFLSQSRTILCKTDRRLH